MINFNLYESVMRKSANFPDLQIGLPPGWFCAMDRAVGITCVGKTKDGKVRFAQLPGRSVDLIASLCWAIYQGERQ